MLSRRKVMLGGLALAFMPGVAHANRRKFKLNPKYAPQTVRFKGYSVGTIVIDPKNRFLYLVEAPGRARRYGIGVGKAGLTFRGGAIIGSKAKWPRWTPTKNMIRRNPKYRRFAGGVPGGPSNPLGARALYLYRNGRDTMFRIHGTSKLNYFSFSRTSTILPLALPSP